MFHQRNRPGLVTLTNHGISSESKDDVMLLTTRDTVVPANISIFISDMFADKQYIIA